MELHQNNYLRLQELRKASSALDAQIRDTLSSLATTRKDIVTTHTTTFPEEPNHPLAYEELLKYAQRISRTTLPPAGTINNLTVPASGVQTPAPESQPQLALTPSAPTPSQTQSPAGVNGVTASQPGSVQPLPAQQPGGGTSANTTLPEIINQYLNPLSGQIFFPWPTEDKIRSGALASNQLLLEQGIDPRGYDPAKEEERKLREEEERKAGEEREKAERREREKKIREDQEKLRREREREQEEFRRASVAAGGAGPATAAAAPAGGPPGLARSGTNASEKKQFQFASLDDLDDDDDE